MPVKLLLSRLAYEAILEAVTTGGGDLSYDAYCQGDYLDNQDYEEKCRKVWGGLNTALARLSDYDKLPLFCEEREVSEDKDTHIETIVLPDETKEVYNVYYDTYGGYVTIPFGIAEKSIVLHRNTGKKALMVEYSKSFPHFTQSDIVATVASTATTDYTDDNIDLAEKYHLTPEGFEYAKKMAEAEIMRIIDPARANDLINIAENYFNDMATYRPTHRQRKVANIFKY